MDFLKAAFDCWLNIIQNNYKNFEGRVSRKEFWSYILIQFLIGAVLGALTGIASFLAILSTIFSLATFIPTIALYVRRLKDINKTWHWLLLILTGIGSLYVVYLFVQPGDEGSNQYGDSPIA